MSVSKGRSKVQAFITEYTIHERPPSVFPYAHNVNDYRSVITFETVGIGKDGFGSLRDIYRKISALCERDCAEADFLSKRPGCHFGHT